MTTITRTLKATKWCKYGCTQVQSVAPQSLVYTKDNAVSFGANHPDWRDRIANHRDATTSMSGELWRWHFGPGSIYLPPKPGACTHLACFHNYMTGDIFQSALWSSVPWSSFLVSEASSADDRSKVRFLNKATRAQSPFSGGVFLGELGQTLRLITNPAKTLRKSVDNYLERAKKLRTINSRPFDFQRAVAGTYLEYVFGWLQLIRDIQDGGKALDKIRDRETKGQRIYSVDTFSTMTNTIAGPSLGMACTTNFMIQDVYKATVVYRGYVGFEPDNSFARVLNSTGLQISEFIPSAYEVLPWSFVIDYFTNIGGIINGWSRGRGGLSWSNKTIIKERRRTIPSIVSVVLSRPDLHNPAIFVRPKYDVAYRRVDRSSYSGNFIPNFRWELPGFGSAHWLNLEALRTARFRRFF